MQQYTYKDLYAEFGLKKKPCFISHVFDGVAASFWVSLLLVLL